MIQNGKKFYLAVLFVAVLFTGCQANHGMIKQSIPENSLTSICEERNIPWQWDSLSQVLVFSHPDAPAKGMVGSKLILVGNRRITLSYPLERKFNTIVVPPDFVRKVFGKEEQEQLDSGLPTMVSGRLRTIIVDAGHGGHDPGAIGLKGAVEKDIVLDVALKLKIKLERMGFAVVMTREADEFVSLQKRTELAAQKHVDLFLSIHANSVKSRDKRVKGFEIYYARKLDEQTDLTQRNNNENSLLRNFEIAGNRAIPEKILSNMMYTNKMAGSYELADRMIKRASVETNSSNRGIRSSGFYVVKNTLVPAILFEIGYVTHESEAKLLKTSEYRQKIADAIAESVKEYSNES